MIKTLIADDERHALDRLKELLSDYDQFQIVAEANSGTGALEKMVSLKPDVVFLDINMPGVSVFKTISSLQDPPLVVFQTAHSKYAADAFDINALDYLMKPVSRERFSKAVAKIVGKISATKASAIAKEPVEKEQTEKISIKVREAIKIIQVCDIQKICFEEGFSFIYTEEGRFLSDRSLNYYEEKFEGVGFFRSNRATLVNLEFVTTLHKGFKGSYLIELKDGSRVELSRRKALILKKTIDF
ncbi:MAG: response regulator transcription factor [Deltaproteobacteria bacterium]|jgi:two-component system, LytTR family, response regulator|nr:response regulator transcription factor [Deltaproteobacteria bacterium]MBT6499114.1 response regulator transcription factor [Deltaproteobacteria bacterium]MBT6612134.1 response regulator transcription factor [Deltaproteobacteria bacterium]MBT7151563.1 response regulator transcription factor [Deltaproteobacteria bacterium]MBT7713674.1 response regulator transcription factor [Deltaproteobacteria bacterium]